MRRLISCLAASAVAIVPSPALSLSFGVEAGLDKKTRNFLEAYPRVIREQVVGMLSDALPLYKDGVAFTFKEVNESIRITFSEIECIQSTVPITAEESAHGFLAAFSLWGKRYGSRTATNLEKQFGQMRSALDGKIKPQSASMAYLDVLGSAHATDCYYRSQPEEALAGLKKTEADIVAGQRVWNFLIDFACDTPRACYKAVYDFDARLVGEADPRDVVGADAKTRLSHLPKPTPNTPNGFDVAGWNLFGGHFDVDAYETHLRELMAIQFDIGAQAILRAQKAVSQLDALDQQLVDMNVRTKALTAAFDGTSSKTLTGAFSNDAGGKLLTELNSLDVQRPLNVSDAEIVIARQKATVAEQKRLEGAVSKMNSGYSDRLKVLQAKEQIRLMNMIKIHVI